MACCRQGHKPELLLPREGTDRFDGANQVLRLHRPRRGFYGIETTPRRMLSEAFNARTPVPGLFLSAQDVMSPGIAGALAGGMFGAAAIDPRVFQKLR